MGVIVPVLGAARFSLSARVWTISPALLLVALSLSAFSAAQIADQKVNAAQSASSEAQQTTSARTDQDSPVNPMPPAVTASQVPTAAQIETAAQQDKPEGPDAQETELASKPAVQNTQPNGATQAGPVPPKYDVSQIGRRNIGTGLDFYSLDREIALGRQLSHEVEMSARLVSDPVVNEYINRIGQNLVRNSDARVPFTIKILDTDEVNAFALPGGFFYVNSGLILAADDEAELAGVMAHEIAHVAARHATKNMTRAQIWNMASMPLIFIGGPVAYVISEIAGLAVPMTYLKFSRDAEREADLLGLEYDYAAGYDPHAFVEFFEKLNLDGKKKHSALAKAFATHPMNADRIKAAQDEIRMYLPDRPEYVVDTSEFENVKTRLISLENGRRLGGTKGGDGNRPVLLRRTGSSSSGGSDSTQSSTQDGNSKPDPKDDGRPTLKRSTTADSN